MKIEMTEEQQLCEVLRIEGFDGAWCGYEYSYDGAPDYATEFRDYDHEYYTVVEFCGCSPEILKDEQGGHWTRVATFSNSGETECPCRYVKDAEQEDCPTCEGDGYIYVGDCAEVVYRKMSPFEVMAMVDDSVTMKRAAYIAAKLVADSDDLDALQLAAEEYLVNA